ncbi:hypothetical protein TCAL_16219, partial [Tigriopus californicus]
MTGISQVHDQKHVHKSAEHEQVVAKQVDLASGLRDESQLFLLQLLIDLRISILNKILSGHPRLFRLGIVFLSHAMSNDQSHLEPREFLLCVQKAGHQSGSFFWIWMVISGGLLAIDREKELDQEVIFNLGRALSPDAVAGEFNLLLGDIELMLLHMFEIHPEEDVALILSPVHKRTRRHQAKQSQIQE